MASRGSALLGLIPLLVVLAVWIPHPVSSLRILLVPQNLDSHYIMFLRMGEALVAEGHEAVLVAASNGPILSKIKDSKVRIHEYEGVGPVPISNSDLVSEIFLKLKFTTSMFAKMSLWVESDTLVFNDIRDECLNLMRNESLRRTMEGYHFDLAIVDPVGLPCVLNYAASLRLPYVHFSIPAFTAAFRLPDLFSFVPNPVLTDLGDRMTFRERLENIGIEILGALMYNTTNMVDPAEFPALADYTDMYSLIRDGKFWFFLEDIALAYPRPSMPNTVSVGDLMLKPPEKLQSDFQLFMDESPEGVILLSFGSYFDFMPKDVLDKICAAFSKIPYKVIWKNKISTPCGSMEEGTDPELLKRLKIVKWMPQNALLAHPNLKLFITHGGLNSALEGLYHGKPMVVFPVALDQPFNARLIERKGYGSAVDIGDFSTEELLVKIKARIGDADTLSALKRGTAILKEKVTPVSKRIDFWVEHVVKYGDAHMRSAAFDLHILQFYMVDIFLFGLGLITCLLVAALLVCCCLVKTMKYCCRKGCSKGNKKKTE